MSESKPKIIPRVEKNILDSYWKLSDKDINTRVNACATILLSLLQKQSESENEICPDLQYSLERLVKGLASPRGAARLGFCLLLTEILKKMEMVQIEEILELMKKHLVIAGKQDKRDVIFGQLFTYAAIVRSGRLPNHPEPSHIILSLYELCEGKSYIVNSCYEITQEAFSNISAEDFKKSIWGPLKKKMPRGWDHASADSIWLLLLCLRVFPASISEKYLRNHWSSDDILAPENLDCLKRITKQTTSSLPALHPFCSEFVLLAKNRKDFNEVWNSVVDDNLFDVEGKEKAVVGFEMIKLALKNSPTKKIVKTVFSPKFRTVFSKSYLNSKHPMNPAANHMAEFLCAFVKGNAVPDMQITVLKAFLQLPGTVLLDPVLKKKEVSLIIQNLLPDAVKAFSEILKAILLKRKSSNDEDKEASNIKRFQAIYQFVNLIAHPGILSDLEWRLKEIQFLFLHAFFVVQEASNDIPHCDKQYDPLCDNLRDACMNGFYKACNSLHIRTEGTKSTITTFLEQMTSLADYADLLLSSTDKVQPLFEVDKIQQSWSHMKGITHKLKKQSEKNGLESLSHAFQSLFLMLGFQLFHDPKHISKVLEELYICCKKALKASKKEESSNEGEPPWIGVVIDILLSLLSKSSRHLRSMVAYVFPLFCPFIDSQALQQVLDVIYAPKDGDDVLVDESEEDENPEEVEFGSGSSSEESEDESNLPPVDNEFKKKIQQALGPAADDSDAESVYLSDSEMFKLDDALSHVFKSRVKSGHSQLQSEEKSLLHFRVRCCDLILSFVKTEPSMYLVLMCLEPVLSAYESSHQNKHQFPLQQKTVHVLQAITKLRKFQDHDNVSKSELKRLLDVLIPKCHREINMSTAQKLYSLCVFIVLCYRKLVSKDSPEKVKHSKTPSYLKIYLSSLDSFVSSGNCHLLPQFFAFLMEACPDISWNFVEPCKDFAFSDNVRLFKKTQCLGLLLEALKFSKSQKTVTDSQWLDFGKNVLPLAIKHISKTLENPDSFKPVLFVELLNVIFTTHTIVEEKTGKSLLKDFPDLLTLIGSANQPKLKKLNSRGRSLKNKIIRCLGGEVVQSQKAEKNKRKLFELNNDGDTLLNGEANPKENVKKSKKKKRKQSVSPVVENNCDSSAENS